jgi:pimeloyl-ACP methyl ester carboxylesterase
LTEGRERIFFKYLFDTKMLVREAISDSDLSRYTESYARPGRMAGFAYYRAAIESVRQNSAAVPPSVPVLAIGGEGSLGSAMHRALEAAKTPDFQGAVFAGVGHYLPEEAPREFVDYIVRFAKLRS